MRLFTVLILVFISFISTAQSLEDKIGDSVCKCIESSSLSDKKTPAIGFVDTCLKSAMIDHEEDILNANGGVDATNYSQGYEFGQRLGPKVMASLVLNCDLFYESLDSLRWSVVKGTDEKTVREDISKNSKALESDESNADLYFERGKNYVWLKEYDNAALDFQKAVELEKDFSKAHVLLGMVKETQGDLKGAKAIYERVAELENNPFFELFLAIIERKERDTR